MHGYLFSMCPVAHSAQHHHAASTSLDRRLGMHCWGQKKQSMCCDQSEFKTKPGHHLQPLTTAYNTFIYLCGAS